MSEDEQWMAEALIEAQKAFALDEVPIGAVIVRGGEVIARGHNRRNTEKNVLRHAELMAIEEACHRVGDWRLEDCTLYVTIEPCPMCAGAILQARIPRVVFGARNPKAGCVGSVFDLLREKRFNHQAEVTEGVCLDECSGIMKTFFRRFRRKKNEFGPQSTVDTSKETGYNKEVTE